MPIGPVAPVPPAARVLRQQLGRQPGVTMKATASEMAMPIES